MSISFDNAAADLLITTAGDAADELREQGSGRRTAAETAVDGFSGTYATLFETACAIESEDRGKLAGVLDELVTQVEDAKLKAEEEVQRQADLTAWTERESARERERATGLTGTAGPISEPYDPKPSETPVQAPTVSAAFTARGRSRSPGAGSTGKSSAVPNNLGTFVTNAKSANDRLEEDVTAVKTAWAGFTSSCSWVSLGTSSFVTGFENLLEENRDDVDWIERVAAAFELAGSGGVFNPATPLSDAMIGLAAGLMDRYRGKLVIPGGSAVIPAELINPSAIDADWPREFTNGKWYSINPNTGFRAPVGSWGYQPLSPAAQKPPGWRERLVFSANPQFGAPPAWARWGSRGLGVAGAGLSYWGAYADSYNENLTAHPDWEESQRQERAAQDSAIVGTATVAGSLFGAAAVGAAIGSVVPGPGTAVGFLVGLGAAIVGGIVGGWAGNEAGQEISDAVHGENDGVILAPGPLDQPLVENGGLV